MIHMRDQLLKAVLAHANGEIQKHKANVEVYLSKSVGIGEHPQFIDELDKLINKISSAEENIQTLNKYFTDK